MAGKEIRPPADVIIYNTDDGRVRVDLYARDGSVWLNQKQLAELFATSVPNISMHISNILQDRELDADSVVKDYLTTAADGKTYDVTFYSLEMIIAIGFRVRSKRGTQFRIWANRNLREYMTKGFLSADEIDSLNRLVVIFLETAELRAKNRQDITMDFWRGNVDQILTGNDFALLEDKGSVSHKQMEDHTRETYRQFDARRKRVEAEEADRQDEVELTELEDAAEALRRREKMEGHT